MPGPDVSATATRHYSGKLSDRSHRSVQAQLFSEPGVQDWQLPRPVDFFSLHIHLVRIQRGGKTWEGDRANLCLCHSSRPIGCKQVAPAHSFLFFLWRSIPGGPPLHVLWLQDDSRAKTRRPPRKTGEYIPAVIKTLSPLQYKQIFLVAEVAFCISSSSGCFLVLSQQQKQNGALLFWNPWKSETDGQRSRLEVVQLTPCRVTILSA